MGGAATRKRAIECFQNQCRGDALVACGLHDKIATLPVVQMLASRIRDCPPVLEVADAGHFCQERGEIVARKYLELYPS